jgi:hypothetical protein
MNLFEPASKELLEQIALWEPRFLDLQDDVISERRNRQNRSIRQIVGHMVDSASNNTHRIIHLQYEPSPLYFPDYANLGNNDRWIAIQNYQEENWEDLVQLWKTVHLHIIHVVRNIRTECLGNEWISALNQRISLRAMVLDFPRHFRLHCDEIEELIDQE